MTNFETDERPDGYETELDTSSLMWREIFVKALTSLINQAQQTGSIKKVPKEVIQNFRRNSGGLIINRSCSHPDVRNDALCKIEMLGKILSKLDDKDPLKIEFLEILRVHREKLELMIKA